MLRSQIGELFFITHVGNVESILRMGILSHNRAARVRHAKVDLDTVQEIRSNVRVSPSRMLHDHANLYVCGRNAMMYHVVHNNPINGVCLLRVSPDVLALPDVVVTDGNAARVGTTRFDDAATGIAALDYSRVHAGSWIHDPDYSATYEHKRVKQAEVLVPESVDPAFVIGAYAPTPVAAAALDAASGGRLGVVIVRYPFFDGRGWT
jgi:hypothetical protein